MKLLVIIVLCASAAIAEQGPWRVVKDPDGHAGNIVAYYKDFEERVCSTMESCQDFVDAMNHSRERRIRLHENDKSNEEDVGLDDVQKKGYHSR